MARRVYFSFHYEPDNWRASQIRNAGVVEGNPSVSDSEWDTITKNGDMAIDRWIASQMDDKPCAVVLIGSATAGRKWITYEIAKAWVERRGVVGIYIHNLKDASGAQSSKGGNPFDYLRVTRDSSKMSDIIKAYDPPFTASELVCAHIKENIDAWVEEAIAIRKYTVLS